MRKVSVLTLPPSTCGRGPTHQKTWGSCLAIMAHDDVQTSFYATCPTLVSTHAQIGSCRKASQCISISHACICAYAYMQQAARSRVCLDCSFVVSVGCSLPLLSPQTTGASRYGDQACSAECVLGGHVWPTVQTSRLCPGWTTGAVQ